MALLFWRKSFFLVLKIAAPLCVEVGILKKLFIVPLFFFGSIFFTWINPGNGGIEMDYGPFDLVLNSSSSFPSVLLFNRRLFFAFLSNVKYNLSLIAYFI